MNSKDLQFTRQNIAKSNFSSMKTKTIAATPIEETLTDYRVDSLAKEFLESQKKNTKHTYYCYWKRLSEFTSESGSQMLDHKEQWERKIFAYQEFLRTKGYSANYVESNLGMVRGFFSFNRKPLMLTSIERKKIRQRTRTTIDYELTTETLAKMYLCGVSARVRYIVAVAKSIGLRAEDFSKITYGQLRALDLDGEAPLFLGAIETMKEGVKAHCFLDSDAITAIKDLLATSTDKRDNEEVWKSTPKGLSPLLRRLAHKAHIDTHGSRLRFHCFRKYLFDNLNTCMSIEKAKMIIGKQVSEGAYLSTATLRDSFSQVLTKIAFNGNGIKAKVKDLEQENKDLKNRIAELENENKALKNTVEPLREGLTEIIREKVESETKTIYHQSDKKQPVKTVPVKATKWTDLLAKLQSIEESSSKDDTQ